jgi:hypothetical protein
LETGTAHRGAISTNPDKAHINSQESLTELLIQILEVTAGSKA